MKKFLIAEAEKARILGMHYKAMGKSLVNEQEYDPEVFRKAGIQSLVPTTPDEAKLGNYYVSFTENTNGRRYYYYCATDKTGSPKGGQIVDANFKLANDPFVLSNTPEFKKMMADACKPALNYLAQERAKNAPQPQVAAATTKPTTATAPNPTTDKDVADAQKRSESSKANTAQMKVELTTKLADPNFLNPNKYDTDKAGLDADAKSASLYMNAQGVVSGDEAMQLKRKINTLIKAKPEYKSDPYYLNINF